MTDKRLLIPVYGLTLLLSAFLLFAVQPLLGKMILPLLGGAPAVWNAAMVFFQAMLLAGYAYAHFTSGMKPSWQAGLHIALLVVCALALPVAIPEAWKSPPSTDNPVLWQLAMMSMTAGGPFFALAATAPLLQRWFTFTGHKDALNPYFLYAASNLGSMAALLLYPFLIEPQLTLGQQTAGWAWGYGLLIALIAFCALLAGRGEAAASAPEDKHAEKPAMKQIGLWLLLAFLPSSLMLGVTTYITTDIAAVPLLWTIPLALYTGSFIVAFARKWPVSLNAVTWLQGVALAAVLALAVYSFGTHKLTAIVLHLILLSLSALLCHMQLAQARPPARYLTLFYLAIAAGGVAGGLFNTLAAPWLFPFPLEYPIVLAVLALLRYHSGPVPDLAVFLHRGAAEDGKKLFSLLWKSAALAVVFGVCIVSFLYPNNTGQIYFAAASFAALSALSARRWVFAAAAVVLLFAYPDYLWKSQYNALAWQRNFFGILRVEDDSALSQRMLIFNTTIHGAQALDERYKKVPLTYFSTIGPAGDVFEILSRRPGKQNVAALGLGLGSIACYALPERHFDFYEINPAVVKMAEDPKLFTYLSGCGSDYKIIMGDARLSLEKAPDHYYDAIFADAFSSDNIPVHLMTQEAFRLYFSKLKPGGVIVVNISNRYLNLGRVLAANARDLHVSVMFRRTPANILPDGLYVTGADYAVLSGKSEELSEFLARDWGFYPALGWNQPDAALPGKAWRDDYSDIAGALYIAQEWPKNP